MKKRNFLAYAAFAFVALAQGLRGPAEKELIYVTLPGTLEGSWDANGNGIVVLDAKNNYNFVKRIPTWDVPASRNPEQVAGVTASPVTRSEEHTSELQSHS